MINHCLNWLNIQNLNTFNRNLHQMAGKIRINRIKSILVEKEISQKDLAQKVKRTPNTITRICNNESQPTLKLLREIALALDVDIRELLISTKS